MAYCDIPQDSYLWQYFCGIQAAFTGPAADVVTHGQDTVGGAVDDAKDAVLNGQNVIGGAVGDVADAANPLNLLGLGTGLGLGAVATAVGVGLVGAFAADQLLAGGAGTAALLKRAGANRSRR